MARYRQYPKYVPKIEIEKSWADKLKKLNSQQLTLMIQQAIGYQGKEKQINQRMQEAFGPIPYATSAVKKKRINKQEEIDARSSGLKNAFNKFIWGSPESNAEQDNEIRTAIINDKEISNLIDKALKANDDLNKIEEEANSLLKEINEFLTDSNWQGEIVKPIEIERSSFYSEWFSRRPNFIHTSQYLGTVKKSLYEIRKIINKNEKSAKLASYQDKSRNVGKSLMSKMKSDVSSPFYCPYCFKKIPKTKIHVDHINPVSNGGLSVERNLVPVCSDCNLNKSDLSLRAFCKKNAYDYEVVCNTLDSMGKFI